MQQSASAKRCSGVRLTRITAGDVVGAIEFGWRADPRVRHSVELSGRCRCEGSVGDGPEELKKKETAESWINASNIQRHPGNNRKAYLSLGRVGRPGLYGNGLPVLHVLISGNRLTLQAK